MTKPTVLFFSRNFQAEFFPQLASPLYNSIHATLTLKEKKTVIALGGQVVACFEEEYDQLGTSSMSDNYMISSLASDRYLNVFNVNQRMTILRKEKSFWENILEKHKPNTVVNELIAIEMSEVLYIECKLREIEYLAWLNHPIDNYFYWMDTPMHSSLQLQYFTRTPSSDHVKLAEDYCRAVEANHKPFYIRNLKSRFNLIDLLKDMKSLYTTLKTRLVYFRNKKKSYSIFGADHKYYLWKLGLFFRSLVGTYDDLQDYSDFEVIFYPLHFEPEATILYMAEFHCDQPSTISYISKCLKLNQVLVVKEHPSQKGMLLTRVYQNLKKVSSNIVFIRAEHNSQDLISRSKAVVTLTGTVGLEALILGKPVIVLGNVFYDNIPSVQKIKSLSELRELIRSDHYHTPSRTVVVDFLANLLQICHRGNPFPHKDLFSVPNLSSIAKAIEAKACRQ